MPGRREAGGRKERPESMLMWLGAGLFSGCSKSFKPAEGDQVAVGQLQWRAANYVPLQKCAL